MRINSAKFVTSSKGYLQCPQDDRCEFAFIGRSNVGKSSIINALTSRNNLAKISSQPGKTQLINHFIINDDWYLVDLPGYGWAKVSKTEKTNWKKMTDEYLTLRNNLVCVFLLVDIRLPPQKIDLEFIDWLGVQEIPFSIVFTKADKLSKSKNDLNINQFTKALENNWEELPSMFTTSSVKKSGIDELLKYINKVLRNTMK